MKILVKKTSPLTLKTPCLVLFTFSESSRQPLAAQLDQQFCGLIAQARRTGEYQARPGDTLLLHNPGTSGPARILLVGLGKAGDATSSQLRQAASVAAATLKQIRLRRFAIDLNGFKLPGTAPALQVQAITEGLLLADYRFDRYLTADRPDQPKALEQVSLLCADAGGSDTFADAVSAAEAICAGTCLARDLVNAPGNLKSPEYLALQAVAMAEQNRIKARLLDRRQMERLGFGALLGVARGSSRPPYLIVLEYQGAAAGTAPIALIGKGVTFDSGGISLKPADKMDEMKMDMGGAAAVLGTLLAAARLQLPINLVAVIPAVENMPSGDAIRPGDILTSLSGKTIEVLNTDAEGRLILADALTYVERFKPRTVIDLATLTGACIIALGNQAAAVLGNDERLISKLRKAGERSGERLWQLPLWDEYASQIKSDFADVKNTGGRPAGTITAAAFLQKFADQYSWAHLDIAGMAWEDRGTPGRPRGGTGFGVRVLIDYLREESS